MGKLTIIRGKGWAGKWVYFHVLIDNRDIGSVGYNSFANFELSNGPHMLSIKIGDGKSREVPVNITDSPQLIFKIVGPSLWDPIKSFMASINLAGQLQLLDITHETDQQPIN